MLTGAYYGLMILSFLSALYSLAIVFSVRVVWGDRAIHGVQNAIIVVANVLLASYALAFSVVCYLLAGVLVS